uniref:BET1-like protein n=1 Tax=Ciona intestinalis TaxID=7719 RepID=H2XY24_CIOIN|nr:BET1-like protein isoform X2 [Ciona intestinalis]|eukprot:XP_002126644.1 BET1-like protein isoform X2 [Ciona intestinalis]
MANWNKGSSVPDTEQIMEAENNRLADQLASKVSRLKMISLDMKDGVEDDNTYLDGMNSDFMSTTGLLGGSVTRFSKMMDSGRGNRKLMCYIIASLVVAFFILYFILTRSKT